MTSTIMRGKVISEAKYERLRDAVGCRLYADGDNVPIKHDTDIVSISMLDLAKRDALTGDFTRLKRLYPELADTFDRLKPKASKRVRRNAGKYYVQFGRDMHAWMIKDIRRIVGELTGQKRPDQGLVVRIASDILKCKPSVVTEIVKRGR
jgi:hypothetical protein